MITRVDRTAREYVQQAETPEEADRLRHQSQVLGVARHPGVVQLLAMEGDTLRLRLVDGERFRDWVAPSPDDMVRVAAAAATTLADLHDIGVVHGAISADHLLIDDAGQPILCGFGRGAIGHAVGDADRAEDVAALATVLLAVSSGPPLDGARHRILAAAGRGGRAAPSARRLASVLGATPPEARRRRGLRVAVPVLLASAVVVAVTAVLRPRGDTPHPAATACPAIDLGCRPLPRPGGVIETSAGRYRIGGPGDLVVIGRWRCRTTPVPALLRTANGQVWVWTSWAGRSGPVAARLVTRVPGARSVQVDPGTSGCDRLRVVLSDGRAIVVQPGGIQRGGAA